MLQNEEKIALFKDAIAAHVKYTREVRFYKVVNSVICTVVLEGIQA